MTHPRTLLRQLEQRARRRFGQHFLWRTDVVETMVRRAGILPGSRVLEIGPGLGMLTSALLAAQTQVTALELDHDLAAFVRERYPRVHLVQGDALWQAWPELCPGSDWQVLANLPYNIGTHVVMRLLAHPSTFASLVVMLQKEVVERMVAAPGSRTYGALSVQVQVRAQVQWLMTVPPEAFFPAPKVYSSVLQLRPYSAPLTGDATLKHFDRVVGAAFAHRRKTVLNSLSSLYPKPLARSALDTAGILPSHRAEVLQLGDFRRLAAALPPLSAPKG